MFKIIRITILLLILASVTSTLLLQRDINSDWDGSIDIQLIPVIADTHSETERYVKNLRIQDFGNIERYLIEQGATYKKDLSHSFDIRLNSPIYEVPPVTPAIDATAMEIMLWSLRLRWWAWRQQAEDYHSTQIRLYVLYQNPNLGESLPHSTGLQNGLIGLIHARVSEQSRPLNRVILTHELLHLLGASDKYDLITGKPIYPTGYADPNRTPRYPQKAAEIMGRSIPLSETTHQTALRLRNTVIGIQTAMEIGWVN